MDRGRIVTRWKEAAKKVEIQHPKISQSDFDFPAQCLSVFMDSYSRKIEEIVGPSIPFEVPISPKVIVSGSYPLLTKTTYGTRITIFTTDSNLKPAVQYANDIFLTLYAHAYRCEFGKNEFAITIHNLGDGQKYDIIKKLTPYQKHLHTIESLAEILYNDYKVPSLASCAGCSIMEPCQMRQYK